VSWTDHRPWTGEYDLDVVELGWRVATTRDDPISIAYRLRDARRPRRGNLWVPGQPNLFGVRYLPNTEHPGSTS
jgi:hypothetical protein